MKIKTFLQYIKENSESSDIHLEYMAFDWDNNILNMSTKIHMEHLVDGDWIKEDVSTEKFATVRNDKDNWRILNGNPDDAFSEFRDNGPRGKEAFLDDTKESISLKSFAPSWNKFLQCLIGGNIFSIITARGHNSDTLRSGVEYIIHDIFTNEQKEQMIDSLRKFQVIFGGESKSDEELISSYLDNCMFFGVSSPDFEKIAPGGATNPEKGKEIAITMFTKKMHEFGKKVNAKKVQLSFSDDDIKNVEHIEKYMRHELSLKYYMQYNVFDTSSGNDSKRIKVTENNNIIKFKKYGIKENVMQLRKALENNDTEYVRNWCYTSPEINVVCGNWRLDANSIKELAFQLINSLICDAYGVLACVEEVLDTMDSMDLNAKDSCLELGRNLGLRSEFFHDEYTEDLVNTMDFTNIKF